ncbi:MAG: Crp/Fnr family transcriptional regulator [Rhizobiaceae bacterium]
MLPKPFDLIPTKAHHPRRFDKNGLVFRQGGKTRGLFFVIDGCIELRRFTEAGQTITIHRARSSETFAEASLFSQTYHCDGIATCESNLVELDRSIILEKIQNDPNFALAIAKRFAQQNQYYRRKLELLAIKSAEDRIYTAIVDGLFTGKIKAFATDIGLTHEAVYRGLAKLVDKSLLIKTGRGKYAPTTTAKNLLLI